MGSFTVRHLVERNGAFYFQATPAMRRDGIFSEPLGRDRVAALTRADYLNTQWDAARSGISSNPLCEGSISWLIREYENSDWYAVLRPRTKEEVDQFTAIIAASPLGKAHVAQVTRRHCRQFHSKLLEDRGRSHANKAIKWLRRLMEFAVDLDLRDTNPASRMQLRHGKPRRVVWKPEEVEAFKAQAVKMDRRNWALAVQLAYDTAQRLGDILGFTWHEFDGEGFTVKQDKTGVEIFCPLSPESLRMLAETERRAIQIIVGDVQGKPIGHRSFFGKIYREIRDAAGLRRELQFRDLRRTAATEASAAGANVEHITGHRPGSPIIKNYVVPNREAARLAQEMRYGKKDS